MNERLEHLLKEKSFDELSAEERYFVTELLTETEYERMHFVIKSATPILRDTPVPSPAIKENLLVAMRQMNAESAAKKPAAPSAIVRLLKTRIPAWQAAAAVALLLGLHFLFPQKGPVEIQRDTEIVYKTDTLYKEVLVSNPVPASPEKTAPRKVAPRVNTKPIATPQKEILNTPNSALEETIASAADRPEAPDTFAITVSQPRGTSATDTEDLWQFIGDIY